MVFDLGISNKELQTPVVKHRLEKWPSNTRKALGGYTLACYKAERSRAARVVFRTHCLSQTKFPLFTHREAEHPPQWCSCGAWEDLLYARTVWPVTHTGKMRPGASACRSLFIYYYSVQLASMKITFFSSLAGQPWLVWTTPRSKVALGLWGCAAPLGIWWALGAQGEQTASATASPHPVYFVNTE